MFSVPDKQCNGISIPYAQAASNMIWKELEDANTKTCIAPKYIKDPFPITFAFQQIQNHADAPRNFKTLSS